MLVGIITTIFTNLTSKAKLGGMSVQNQSRLPWETVVGMGSYLVGDRYCNLDSRAIKTSTEVICGGCEKISSALFAIYNFVKENISFGIQPDPNSTASNILGLGYGDAVGKTLLFSAMTRTAKIPTRFHGYMAVSSFLHGLEPISLNNKLPKKILVIVPEVFMGDKWMLLGGITLDTLYVERLESIMQTLHYKSYGYGLASDEDYPTFRKIQKQWDGFSNTSCQSKAFVDDLGIHTSASTLIDTYCLKGTSGFIWSKFAAPAMTKTVARIRGR